MSSFTYTSKFFSLAPYLLMEYRYGSQPTPEYHPTTFGPSVVGFEKIVNGYFNGAVQIINNNDSTSITGNVRDRSGVQISQNVFVRTDIDRLVQYLDYDNKLTPTSNLTVNFPVNLDIYYDTIRYHFLSGFDFGNADGVILQVQFQERNGKKSTMSQIVYEKNDLGATDHNANPIYFNGGIYDNYVEVKIPSYSAITYDYDTQLGTSTISETAGALLSSDGGGFIRNQPFNVCLFEIENTQTHNDFFYYHTSLHTTATVSPFDEYADLAANVVENSTFDYFEYYPTWQGNFIEDFIYTENSLGNIYYLIHDIELKEQIGLRQLTTQKIQVLQDNEFNIPYVYRPIVMNPRSTSFTINYTMRLVNKTNNVSILRIATLTSTEVDKYGPGLKRINLSNSPYPQKVYNKIIEPSVSKAYTLNVNPLQTVITKYVPAFFERESINISEQDVTIDNLSGSSPSGTNDATVAFGQGNAKIIINPYDNYFKFSIFTNNIGKANTLLDLGNNSQFYLSFEGGNNQNIRVPSLSDSTFQNPNKGVLLFRVVESDSKKITAFTSRDFHIISTSPNGIETSVYYGYWLLPSERSQKPAATGTSAPALAGPQTVVINPVVNVNSTTPGVNVIPLQPSDYFNTNTDATVLNVQPNVITTPSAGTTTSITTQTPISADIETLANAIRNDENAGKAVKDISDYYTIPGNPGNKLFTGLTTTFFLDAVRMIHPDINGARSTEFTQYANYLGVLYDPYENTKYPSGGAATNTGNSTGNNFYLG